MFLLFFRSWLFNLCLYNNIINCFVNILSLKMCYFLMKRFFVYFITFFCYSVFTYPN